MRFFIEDVDNYETSRHDTILEAVKTLHAAAKRLNATQLPAAGEYLPPPLAFSTRILSLVFCCAINKLI